MMHSPHKYQYQGDDCVDVACCCILFIILILWFFVWLVTEMNID